MIIMSSSCHVCYYTASHAVPSVCHCCSIWGDINAADQEILQQHSPVVILIGGPRSGHNDVVLRLVKMVDLEQTALERQDLCCTYLIHHELESVTSIALLLFSWQY